MRIEIENGKLRMLGSFLYDLKGNRKKSRMRRRLISTLEGFLKDYNEELTEIQEHHAKKDAEGKAIVVGEQYDFEDRVAFSKDLDELNKEVRIIEGGDNREMIRTIKTILKDLEEEEYEGQTSEAYDYLCDQFEIDEEEGEGIDESNNNGN